MNDMRSQTGNTNDAVERCDPQTSGDHLIRGHLERYRLASKFVKNKSVMDVACGIGYGSRIMLDAGAQNVTGVDIDENTIDTAQKRYGANNLTFVKDNAEELSALPKNRTFHFIVSFETIEHIRNPDTFLKTVTGRLPKSGSLLISTPCRYSGTLESAPHNPYHLREWSFEEFNLMLSKYFGRICYYGQGLSFIERENSLMDIALEIGKRVISLLMGKKRVSADTDIFPFTKIENLKRRPDVIIALCSECKNLPFLRTLQEK